MKVAVYGLGVSGLATLNYLTSHTNNEVFAINQGRVEAWPMFDQISGSLYRDHMLSEEDALGRVADFDQIILSPGISREVPLIQKALKSGVSVIGDVELAFGDYAGKLIAVTGTNGKTTTVTMISEVLKMGGIDCFTGGNIGTAACEYLLAGKNEKVAVLELSSFQLESIEKLHPFVAVVLNLSETHMERYNHIEDYRLAKYNIFKNCNAKDHGLIGRGLPKPETKVNTTEITELAGFDFSECKLLGRHNRENFFCAYKTLEFLGVPNRDELFQKFIKTFPGVSHRLQYAGSKGGVDFYNDAKSTNYEATRAAITATEENGKPIHLIVGGKLRSDKIDLLSSIKDKKLAHIYTFGEAAELLLQNLSSNFNVSKLKTLDEVLDRIGKLDLENASVLFSPALPSFDQYANYVRRGEHFLKLVNALF